MRGIIEKLVLIRNWMGRVCLEAAMEQMGRCKKVHLCARFQQSSHEKQDPWRVEAFCCNIIKVERKARGSWVSIWKIPVKWNRFPKGARRNVTKRYRQAGHQL